MKFIPHSTLLLYTTFFLTGCISFESTKQVDHTPPMFNNKLVLECVDNKIGAKIIFSDEGVFVVPDVSMERPDIFCDEYKLKE